MNYKSFVLLMIFAMIICISAMGSVSAADSPTANFTSNTTNGSAPLSVQFNDTSTGSPASWYWEFGDGNTSNEQNPAHNYTKNGKYNVSLTATNDAGSNTLSKYITVLPTVNASLAGGTYSTAQTVTLTSKDPTATIYYASDRTDPLNSSTKIKYTGPITINQTTTLRYRAVDSNGSWSPLYVQNYVIGASNSAWSQFGGNSNNTGQSKYTGPKNNFTIWTCLTENPVYYTQPVIGSNGIIYLGVYNGKFYALNPDGTQNWTYSTEAAIWGSAAIGADGTIYFGNNNKIIYALNPDGTQKWNYTAKGSICSSPAIGTDGTIYIGSNDGNLYALNLDGTLQWKYTTKGSLYYAKPAIGTDGTIYIGSFDSKLYAINHDGTLKWTYTAANPVSGSPAISTDGTIYFGDYNGTLYALNPNGTQKWNYTTDGGYMYGLPAIGADGTIYFGCNCGTLYALNPDGTQKWNYTTGGGILGSATIGADGTIYVGSCDSKLYAINPDGTLKWNYTTGGNILSSPAIGTDGTLYIGSQDSNIYAFKDLLPVADFTTDKTTSGVPITVHFTDQSLYAKSWAWDFNGDGITDSTEQNPTHTYTKKGNYTVSLTVYNYLGNSTTKMSIALSILPPVANFTADNTSGTSPLTVHFTDQSSYATSWAWNFGDGTTSKLQNPTHTYKTLGYHTVSLTVTGPGGSNKTTKTNYILIVPSVNASAAGGTYSAAQTVTLTSDDPKSIIYYARDTTDPRNSSTRVKYTGPISISNTTTLRYAAVDIYGNWSPLYLQNYVIGSGGLADTVWAKSSGDLNNTGQSSYIGPEVNTTLWNYTTGGSISSLSSPVIGSDGTIYIESGDGKLYALNHDGTLKWTYDTGTSIQFSPTICADGTIYVGGSNGKLYAINPDGTLKWTYKTRGGLYGAAAAGADGNIYIGSDDGKLYAFNPDGTLKWTYDTGTYVRIQGGGPAIGSDGTIYFENSESYSRGGNLYALNPDGTLKWYYTIGGSLSYSPTIGADGTIYVGGFYGPFYAINPNGTLKWTYMTYTTESERYQSVIYNPAISANGTIYFGCYNGIFYALKQNGTLKWTYSAGVIRSETIGADGTIYIGNDNGCLYALNPDGTQKWNYTTKGTTQYSISCLAIGADETLYFGSGSTVYAIANTVLKANQTAGAAPKFPVQFNASGISPVSWYWDFGDGTNSTEQNPIHKYDNAGYYTVTLTVTSSNKKPRIMSFTNYIKVYNSPTSNFTASTTWGTIPNVNASVYNQIQFNDTSLNISTSWYWDFGDGTNSTLQNPTHTYKTPGIYNVSLTVTNPAGTSTNSTNITVLSTISANSTLADGTYSTPQPVTLTSDDPTATIYYTNDTTDPRTSSTRVKYTKPISISNTTTLRYAAVTTIGNWSQLHVQNYVIGTGGLIDSPNPTYQGDNNHTGQSEYTGPQINNTKWNSTNITSVQDTCISIGSDGTIYAGSSNGILYALYPTGVIKWQHYTESSSQVTTPTIGKDGTIYIAASGYLWAVTTNGTLKWKYQINNFLYSVSPSVGADGTIYITCYDNNGFLDPALYAINPDGTPKWNTSFNDDLGSVVIGSDGTIYVPGDKLYAINQDGTIKWTYDHQCSSLSIGPDGTIYMAYTLSYYVNGKRVTDIGLHALNPNGTLKWNSTINSGISGTAAVASDGTIYLLSGGNLIAINPADGSQKWNYTAGKSCYSSPVIGADGTIYIATSSGIFAVNSSGQLKWNYTGLSANGNPIIDSDSTLYVETSKGLYAFRDIAAKFNYAIGSNPLYVWFNDTSNNATSWSWDFGDGTTSTLQNPIHFYSTSGRYLVTLNALTPEGILTAAQMIIINDTTPPSVTIIPNGGNFNTTQTITLKATDDSDNLIVYYTTDGSDPLTSRTRHIYSAPITINSTTTLDYAAVDTSNNWTPVYEEIYTKSEAVSGTVIYVTSGMDNDQIQSIIDNAAPGSTIEFNGTYYQNLQLTINKQLNIISNVGTKITSSSTSAVFTINGTQAAGTTIKGFTIINTGTGILLNNTSNVTISNDIVSSTGGTAVLINGSSNTTIRSSTIHDSVTGIIVSSSTGTQIIRSSIYSNKTGINIKNSKNTSITKSQITGNTQNGIYVKNSNGVTIDGNTINKNGNIASSGSGIYIEDTKNIYINKNQITENANGLTARSVTNATISNNTVLNNDRDGITLNGVVKNTLLLSNTAQKNNVGIRIDCRSENLTIRANLVTGNIKKSKTLQNSGSGILLGNNYVNSPTFLVEHNVLLNNADMDFRSCAAAGNHLTGSNWFKSGCKQVTYDPQMKVVLTRTGENAFTVQIYDGRTGELVTDLPSLPVTFIMGAYSQMINTNKGSATATFKKMGLMGQVIASIFGYQVAIDYNTPITPLSPASDPTNPNSGGTDNPSSGGNSGGPGNGTGTAGDGPGSGSGTSGSSSGNGASSGSSTSAGVTASASASGSSGDAGQSGSNGRQSSPSKTAQELFIDNTTKNPQFWGIIGIIVLLVLIFGGYYRKDLMSMIKKSKK